ncbi:MAG: trypsin-like peptidase domain-containing protein [Nitrospirota bacterium]
MEARRRAMRHGLEHRLDIGPGRPCKAALCAIASVVACAVGGAAAFEGFEEDMVRIYEQLVPATVSLSSAYASHGQRGAALPDGVGSGFILDETGLIVTNAHVVEGAHAVMATLHDGRRVRAELVGSDPLTDIALLRLVDVKGPFSAVRMGDSSALRVGQRTLVIGNPLGLGSTLTSGIISRIGGAPAGLAAGEPQVLQTTAPINPGNSGGPLVDSEGRVIGVATAMIEGAQNIGFAIPINTVVHVVSELKEKGRVVRPWLGVGGKFVTDELIGLFALPLTPGLLVEAVDPGSPAMEIGLRAGDLDVVVEGQSWTLGGDIITAVQGTRLRSPQDLLQAIAQFRVGQKIKIEYQRDKKTYRREVTLRERPRLPPNGRGTQPGRMTGEHPSHPLPSPNAGAPPSF